MANDPFTTNRSENLRFTVVTLGALIGGVIAFVWSGAITEVLWTLLGVAVGAGIGFAIRAFGRKATAFSGAAELSETATKADLYGQVQELEIDGRSTMDRDEPIAAITEHRAKAG